MLGKHRHDPVFETTVHERPPDLLGDIFHLRPALHRDQKGNTFHRHAASLPNFLI